MLPVAWKQYRFPFTPSSETPTDAYLCSTRSDPPTLGPVAVYLTNERLASFNIFSS